jgi:P27 family predicted phage terminase small subunit
MNRAEPKPKGRPTCPAWLADEAKREWRRLAPKLEEAGLATGVDADALARYCVAMTRWRQAEEELAASGGLLVKKTNGDIAPNPLVAVAVRAMEVANKLGLEFGLTPSSRTRIGVSREEKPVAGGVLNGQWVRSDLPPPPPKKKGD